MPLEEVEVGLRATFDAADKYGFTGQGAAFEQFINKVNSRNTAGEELVRLLGRISGTPAMPLIRFTTPCR